MDQVSLCHGSIKYPCAMAESSIIVPWLNQVSLCHGSIKYPCAMAESSIIVPWLNQVSLCHGSIKYPCAMAQAVSHWLLTTEAQVPSQVIPCEICGGQSDNGTGFLAVDCVLNMMAHSDAREGK